MARDEPRALPRCRDAWLAKMARDEPRALPRPATVCTRKGRDQDWRRDSISWIKAGRVVLRPLLARCCPGVELRGFPDVAVYERHVLVAFWPALPHLEKDLPR